MSIYRRCKQCDAPPADETCEDCKMDYCRDCDHDCAGKPEEEQTAEETDDDSDNQEELSQEDTHEENLTQASETNEEGDQKQQPESQSIFTEVETATDAQSNDSEPIVMTRDEYETSDEKKELNTNNNEAADEESETEENEDKNEDEATETTEEVKEVTQKIAQLSTDTNLSTTTTTTSPEQTTAATATTTTSTDKSIIPKKPKHKKKKEPKEEKIHIHEDDLKGLFKEAYKEYIRTKIILRDQQQPDNTVKIIWSARMNKVETPILEEWVCKQCTGSDFRTLKLLKDHCSKKNHYPELPNMKDTDTKQSDNEEYWKKTIEHTKAERLQNEADQALLQLMNHMRYYAVNDIVAYAPEAVRIFTSKATSQKTAKPLAQSQSLSGDEDTKRLMKLKAPQHVFQYPMTQRGTFKKMARNHQTRRNTQALRHQTKHNKETLETKTQNIRGNTRDNHKTPREQTITRSTKGTMDNKAKRMEKHNERNRT